MISSLVPALISAFKARRELALENVALRQQLAVLRRSVKRPRLLKVDRGFWVLLRRIWTDWESVLVIVKPQTVIRWHRCGFRRYWTWKSRRRRPGRPGVAPEIRELIRNMSRANPLWGAPRVHGELAKLGIVYRSGLTICREHGRDDVDNADPFVTARTLMRIDWALPLSPRLRLRRSPRRCLVRRDTRRPHGGNTKLPIASQMFRESIGESAVQQA